MNKSISRIENDVQDRNSVAWAKLCEYIDLLTENENDEFAPAKKLCQNHQKIMFNFPIQGGSNLKQPPDEDEIWEIEMKKRENDNVQSEQNLPLDNINVDKANSFKLLKVIRKIWEK